jgi:hypothetical protein
MKVRDILIYENDSLVKDLALILYSVVIIQASLDNIFNQFIRISFYFFVIGVFYSKYRKSKLFSVYGASVRFGQNFHEKKVN